MDTSAEKQTDNELPATLQTRITMLSKHDSKLEHRFQKIVSKKDKYGKDRQKGSFMDPKISDFHSNIVDPSRRRNI